jgi:hypothetical protein
VFPSTIPLSCRFSATRAIGPTRDGSKVASAQRGTTSAPNLLSTVFHEDVVHVEQARSGNWGRAGTKGENVNEVEAYDAELRQAQRLGLSQEDISGLRASRAQYYDSLCGTSYQTQVDMGDYSVANGDLAR